jgi:hypothetical protein
MKSRCEFVSGPVVLSMLLMTAPVLAQETEFTYTDDWAVVSAPPPPGPYRAVNIDPRVPGADAIPPLPMDAVTTPSGEDRIPAEALANAPAAGIPASHQPTDAPASAVGQQRAAPPEMPGYPQRVAPSPTGYYYSAPPQYPAQSHSVPPAAPPAAYQGYRNQPAYGYYGSPAYRQGQQQVPPPPMYDSMMRNQYPVGKGTP